MDRGTANRRFKIGSKVLLVSGLWAGREGEVVSIESVLWGNGAVYWVRIGAYRTVFASESQMEPAE